LNAIEFFLKQSQRYLTPFPTVSEMLSSAYPLYDPLSSHSPPLPACFHPIFHPKGVRSSSFSRGKRMHAWQSKRPRQAQRSKRLRQAQLRTFYVRNIQERCLRAMQVRTLASAVEDVLCPKHRECSLRAKKSITWEQYTGTILYLPGFIFVYSWLLFVDGS
jgi:hypothetical protein